MAALVAGWVMCVCLYGGWLGHVCLSCVYVFMHAWLMSYNGWFRSHIVRTLYLLILSSVCQVDLEERLLGQRYPQYEQYKAATPKFIPLFF